MRNIFRNLFLSVALLVSASTFAQPAGYKKVASPDDFKNQMLNSAKTMTSMQSDFKQVKHIVGMPKNIEQTGKFYFKKDDKLALDYLTPMKSQIIMNGSKISMVSGGQKKSIDANSNPTVANLKNMLSSCLSGQLPTNSKDVELVIYENDKQFLVYVTPKSESFTKKNDHIEVNIEKVSYNILSVKIIEKTKNANSKDSSYQEFTFTNMQKNVSIDEKKFSVQ
ncbi:MAG: outer membrane lipoprotein carrier protein LolA [Paludibacteraceae bacterium]|nr:outer membrane lipoprotein carrier protein LolA [Paludibacteraceae bacterium]